MLRLFRPFGLIDREFPAVGAFASRSATTGAAMSVNATQNTGQLNAVGSTVVVASSP